MMAELIEIVRTARVTLPAGELAFLLAALVICLGFGFPRVGILVAYGMLFRWVLILLHHENKQFVTGYIVLGAMVAVLGILGMPGQNRRG